MLERRTGRIVAAAGLGSLVAVIALGAGNHGDTPHHANTTPANDSVRSVIRVAGPGLVAPGHDAAPTKGRVTTDPVSRHAAPGSNRARSDVQRLTPAQTALTRTERRPTPAPLEEDEVGEAAGSGTSTALMYSHGGSVQSSPRVYLVFWGSEWTNGGDPNGVANRLHYFLQGIGGSSWANPLKQYTSASGNFTNPTGQYRGWLRDTTALPTSPTQSQMAAAAARAAAYVGDYSYNAQFFVTLPNGHIDAYTSSARACAWHHYTYAGGNGSWVTYTALSYTPYVDRIYRSSYNVSCGGGMVNGSAGTLDGVTINAGHEYAETVSDPGLNAWYDASGLTGEVGDKCSWENLANRTLANGYSFPVQPLWSNSFRRTYGNGCLYPA